MITLYDERAPAAARHAGGGAEGTPTTGPVLFHRCPGTAPRRHELESKSAVARGVAALMGRDYGGDFDPGRSYAGRPYFVPSETLRSLPAKLTLSGESATPGFTNSAVISLPPS